MSAGQVDAARSFLDLAAGKLSVRNLAEWVRVKSAPGQGGPDMNSCLFDRATGRGETRLRTWSPAWPRNAH